MGGSSHGKICAATAVGKTVALALLAVSMKALSLLQPWASLVVMGHKRIETRGWNTPYRGPLLIHASKGKAGKALAAEPPFTRYIPHFDALPFGAIIGQVTLVDVVRISSEDWLDAGLEKATLEERAFGDYRAGRWAWMLEDAVAFAEPIPAKGSLGLWDAAWPG